MNLHINQILVDNSNGEIDLGALGHISQKSLPRISLFLSLGLGSLSLSAAKPLVECIKIRDAERARVAIWWKQKLPVHFYDVFMLRRQILMYAVRVPRI